MKTSELSGAALDWAVAKCEGATNFWYDTIATHWVKLDGKDRALSKGWAQSYLPSTTWAQGGPIIERAWLDVTPWPNESDENLRWQCKQHDSINCVAVGPTPLIAAMRCYVASKLGDEVDLPKELE